MTFCIFSLPPLNQTTKMQSDEDIVQRLVRQLNVDKLNQDSWKVLVQALVVLSGQTRLYYDAAIEAHERIHRRYPLGWEECRIKPEDDNAYRALRNLLTLMSKYHREAEYEEFYLTHVYSLEDFQALLENAEEGLIDTFLQTTQSWVRFEFSSSHCSYKIWHPVAGVWEAQSFPDNFQDLVRDVLRPQVFDLVITMNRHAIAEGKIRHPLLVKALKQLSIFNSSSSLRKLECAIIRRVESSYARDRVVCPLVMTTLQSV